MIRQGGPTVVRSVWPPVRRPMTRSDTPSLNSSLRPRRTKIIVAWIVCIATIAALVWYRERIDFGILRFRTKTSLVVVSDDFQETAFSLDEQQTQELLKVIDHRTHSTNFGLAVMYPNWVEVYCKDARGHYLQGVWVHHLYGTEDVLAELFRIARRGVPEDPDSRDALKVNASLMERVY